MLHQDRLFPTNTDERAIAKRLFETVCNLPLICPHGHTDPAWFAQNEAFANPTELLVVPDHYVLRMLVSQGIPLARFRDGEGDPQELWKLFADHYYLFRGTPTQIWLDHTFRETFGLEVRLSAATADLYYARISDCLSKDAFRPRALSDSFNIEVIATTEPANDPLTHHKDIANSDWTGRVITAYRPDSVVDPDFDGFLDNLAEFGEISGEDIGTWEGYLNAHRIRRAYFAAHGATSTDHGHPTAKTENLSRVEAEALYAVVSSGTSDAAQNEMFRAQMLTEMAGMSVEDGLVMQLHPGSYRNHNFDMFEQFGRDIGFDIPQRTSYVDALKPLLDRHGMDPRLSLILFTLDESTYARELAPLAGVYPSLKLGPAWWFFDSAAGMMRYRELVTETAGFYNTVGFNDDTRALPSIPARHDVARRVDCAYLGRLVATHVMAEEDAVEVAHDLAYGLAKAAYKL